MILLGLALLLVGCSGLPGLFLRERGAAIATALFLLGALAGLGAAARVLFGAGAGSLALPALPLGSPGMLRLDPLGAFFLVPVLLLPSCGSLYGLGYWGDHHENPRRLRFLYGLATAFLALLVASAHVLVFLLAWEGMAITAFFMVITEDREPQTRRAAWIYLIATHSGTLCLFAAFALMASASGGFLFAPLPPGWAASPRGAVTFLLFLAGFGLKAGILPLHFWLPEAHAAAPSHVSALMSGILIKMGILGLIRLISWVPDPPFWWGALFMALGGLSGVLGVAMALGQHDLKRLLAYHSVENIGIILLGLGLGTLGKSMGQPALQLLGFAGALLHVLNHSLFKGLLFLGAGSILHGLGTRNLERMGGLARTMPFTAATFLVGSWAICGLPPLNGFASEWMIYLAAFRGLGLRASPWCVLGLGALALIGALAAACFTKVFGAAFLGSPRSVEAAGAAESPRSLRIPMGILACACIAIGLVPALAAPALERAVSVVAGPGTASLRELAHLPLLTLLALPLLAMAVLLWAWCRKSLSPRGDLPTWDCGYGPALPRAQYTASSFADGLVSGMRIALWPHVHMPRLKGLFPVPGRFQSHVPDPVLDRLAAPTLGLAARGVTLLRFLQSGQLQVYLLYILLTLFALLAWMVV
jgi:hydrogenase-4 component B